MATKFNKQAWQAYLNNEIIEKKSEDININLAQPNNINAIYLKAKELGICTEPLDIVKVVKNIFNINVYFNDLDRNISGFIERTSASDWAIHVNKWESLLRQKFTIAHELGHFIMHRDILSSGSHTDSILYRDDNNSEIERTASAFAAELLMPKDQFDKYVKTGYNTIDKLSEKFNLSSSAVRYRAYKLNYISEY